MAHTLKQRLILTTALVSAVIGYGGRRAYAACTFASQPGPYSTNFLCDDPTVVTQNISSYNSHLTTSNDFSITTAGTAITLSGDGQMSFLDIYGSSIISGGTGIRLSVTGDYSPSYIGAATINVNSNITARTGILASMANGTTGGISITSNGDIIAGDTGIRATNNTGATGDIHITTGGGSSITGDYYGVDVSQRGTGDVNIDIGGDVSGGYHAISAAAGAAATSMTITTHGLVTGDTAGQGTYAGIYASHGGSGHLSITTYGYVSGSTAGIYALNQGGGALFIHTYGDVTGATFGIIGSNETGPGAFIKTGVGTTVTATGKSGIHLYNNKGRAEIQVYGDVIGRGGVSIYNTANAGDAIVKTGAGSDVKGVTGVGIDVSNYGSGYTLIEAGGDVSGSIGISVYSGATTTDTTITTAGGSHVSSSVKTGINVQSYGTGAVLISADGDVTGKSVGIQASSYGTDLRIETGVGTLVQGQAKTGISAVNYGSGRMIVVADGDVTGHDTGISVDGHGTDLTVATGAGTIITGENSNAITAKNHGSGETFIYAQGDISGGQYGVYVTGDASTTTMTVTTLGTVTGDTQGYGSYGGIRARHLGTGDLTINTYDTVSGGTIGISAFKAGTTGKIDINTFGDISGSYYGIRASQGSGTGGIDITTAGGTTITGGTRAAIYAYNYEGSTRIKSNGDVSGTGGISAYNYSYGVDISISTAAGTMTDGGASGIGISAQNNGTGHTVVDAGGDVSGSSGIDATSGIGTYMTVSTGAGTMVTGLSGAGIKAYHNGAGALLVDVQGDIDANARGIHARNNTGAGLTVTTYAGTSVYSALAEGILADHRGTGNTLVGAYGDVEGATSGIVAQGDGSTANMTVKVGGYTTITGGSGNGISASNYGTGSLAITTGGDVTGGTHGIIGIGYGTDLSVSTSAGTTITGTGFYGLSAKNYGTGVLTVFAGGDITGGNGGIFARNSYGTDLSVEVGAYGVINGGTYAGILARNYGSGTAEITVEGDVTGVTRGIEARNDASATNIEITMEDGSSITSGQYGILANNHGTGSTKIIARGDIAVTGQAGIQAFNDTTATDMDVTIGANADISGGNHGLDINNQGTGLLTIQNNGKVSGNIGFFVSGGGATTAGSIVNNAGATIEGIAGTAIFLTSLADEVSLTINGGHIIGDVMDDNIANGFSTVAIAESFTSQGSFTVSDFGVSAGKTFTFGTNKHITSFNAIENDGTMTVSTAGSTVTGGLKVNNGGRLNANADFSISGVLTNSGEIAIATGKTLSTGTMAAGTGTLIFGVTSEANHAQLTVTGGAANLTGQTVSINVAGSNSITANDETLLIDGLGAIIGGPGNVETDVTDNSVLWSFKIVNGVGITDNSDLYLKAFMSTTLAELADTQNNVNAAENLMDLQGNTTDPELLDVLGALNGASTNEEFNDVLESVQPTVDGGMVAASVTFVDTALNLTGERLNFLRMPGAEEGLSSSGENAQELIAQLASGSATGGQSFGNGLEGLSKQGSAGISGSEMFSLTGFRTWGQLFGQVSQQGRRGGVNGYDSGMGGFALGMDSENILAHGLAGLSFTYGTTHIDSKNAARTDTDVDSYQLTFYSDHDLGDGFYASAMGGYALNVNDTKRHDVGLAPNQDAKGEFNSHTFSARTEVGKAISFDNMTFTPLLTANWVHYMAENYTETGAGGASLHVRSQEMDQVELGAGAKANWKVENGDGSATAFQLHAAYRRDVTEDRMQATSSFTGGGGNFLTEGPEPAADKFTAGMQVKYYTDKNFELTAAYDAEIKQDFVSHAGFLRAGWRF